MVLSNSQFASLTRSEEMRDSTTGRKTHWVDIDVPDRQPHEPLGVRGKVVETGKNQWQTFVHHGPFEQRDERGSYYRLDPSGSFEGTGSAAKAHAKRLAKEAMKQWRP